MSLLSFSEFKHKLHIAFKRFPLPIAFAAIFTISAIWGTELNWESDLREQIYGVTIATLLFYPLSIGVITLLESVKAKPLAKTIPNAALIVLFGLSYFFWFKDYTDWTEMQALMTGLWGISSVFFVFVSPYILKKKSMEDFWQYSTSIFGRILLTVGFFGLMYLGIVLLLASVDYLFAFELHEELFPDAFFILSGIAGQLFFLSEVPRKYDGLGSDYPLGLKYFIQYLFVPLIIAYLVVLYAYTGSIVATWEWPKGGVAIWIIVFCTGGVFTYFFSHSLKEVFYKYVEIFRKSLFYFIIPLTLVLFFAVGLRISDYGVTEARYFGVLMGIWLLITSIYYISNKKKDLRFFPITLIVFIMVSSYGPFSAFSISRNSQVNQLSQLVEEGKKYTHDEEYRIKNIINYLNRNHGLESLEKALGDLSEQEGIDSYTTETNIYKMLGMSEDYYGQYYFEYENYTYLSNEIEYYNTGLATKGHENHSDFYLDGYSEKNIDVTIADKETNTKIEMTNKTLTVSYDGEDVLEVTFEEYADQKGNITMKNEDATQSFENDKIKGEITLMSVTLAKGSIDFAEGFILFTEK